MTLFQLGEETYELHGWAKHHPKHAIPIKRELDGEMKLHEDEKFISLALAHPDHITHGHSSTYSASTQSEVVAKDTYLVFENKSYMPTIKEFVPSKEGQQATIGMRFKFLFQEYVFYLDVQKEILGDYPVVNLVEELEDFLNEALDEEGIYTHGIAYDDTGDGIDLYTVSTKTNAEAVINVELYEIINAFVAFEIYQYDVKEV